MKRIENFFEKLMFRSRWILVPFYVGLIAANVLLIVKFFKEFIGLIPSVLQGDQGQVIAGILSLIDIVLVANLVLIIIFAGYENFISKMEIVDPTDRPNWMGRVGFSDLKMKVVGSIVAISAIELLRSFMNLDRACSSEQLAWKVGIHITFVFSGIGFVLMDRLNTGVKGR